MSAVDDWDNDPAVQMMRRVFRQMENFQDDLLKRLGISPYNARLRRWREKALELFEQSWRASTTRGLSQTVDHAAALYRQCLATAMSMDGVEILPVALGDDEKINRLIRESLS
jgi:hypothetical protein